MAKRVKGEWADSLSHSDKAFEPVALALGQLILSWNDLHETLAIVFCSVMGGGNIDPAMAIWHAIKVDRTQRDILKASVKAKTSPIQAGTTKKTRDRITDDVEWLCDRIDRLEDTRNNVAHSPFWGTGSFGQVFIAPLTGLGHVRAKKLEGKNILAELEWCRDATITLRNFAMEMDYAMSDYKRTWPDRPKLPTRPAQGRTKA